MNISITRSLIIGVALLGITAPAQNGTVHFGNDSACLVTNGNTGAPVLSTQNVQAALYWAPLASNTFTQIGAAVVVGVPAAGIIPGGTRSAGSGTPGGSTGKFQVRAWGGGFATFEQAAGINGVLLGHSAVITVTTGDPWGDPPTPPTALTAAGLAGFALTNNSAAAPLQLTCATNKIVACGTPWDFDAPLISGGCGNGQVAVVATVTNGGCPRLVTRTWSATDSCAAEVTCSQTVTIVDVTPPSLTCASNKTVNCGTAWSFDAPSATDLCDPAVGITILSTTTNGICPRLVTRTWLAMDACGNTNHCAQTVTILETTPFTVAAPPDKIVTCTNAWSFDLPTVTGGCLDSTGVITELGTSTNSHCPLILARSWEVTSVCGGTPVVCTQTVVVLCPSCPGLTLTKSCPPYPVPPGGSLNYTGTVTNNSEVLLTNVIVWNDQPSVPTIVFGPVTLPPGAGAAFTGSYTVPANLCAPVTDTLTAAGLMLQGVGLTNTLTSACPVATTITPGDTNGDGIVDQGELNIVLANYWPHSPWLYMTNPVALGNGHFQFALTNASAWNFTVLTTTNFSDWTNLPEPAYPVYQFHDPEATNVPQRYYRLQWP